MSTFTDLFILVLFFNIIILAVCLSHTLKCITQSWEKREHFNYGNGKNVWTLLNPNIGVALVFVTIGLNIILLESFNLQVKLTASEICDYAIFFVIMVISYLLTHITTTKTTNAGYTLICVLCTITLTVILFVGNILTFLRVFPIS